MWENDCVCLCVCVCLRWYCIYYIYTVWGMTYVNIYNSSWMFLQKLWGKLQHILLMNAGPQNVLICKFEHENWTRKCVAIWSGILPSTTLRETAKYKQRACSARCLDPAYRITCFSFRWLCIPRNDAYNSNYNAATTEFAKKAAVD